MHFQRRRSDQEEADDEQKSQSVATERTDQGWPGHWAAGGPTQDKTLANERSEILAAGASKGQKMMSAALRNAYSQAELDAVHQEAHAPNPQFDGGAAFDRNLVRDDVFPISKWSDFSSPETDLLAEKLNTSNMVTQRRLQKTQHEQMQLHNQFTQIRGLVHASLAHSPTRRRTAAWPS